jgi:predicted alpha/beta-hydrolase family hydrolase
LSDPGADLPELIRDGPPDAEARVLLTHGAGAPATDGFMQTLTEGLVGAGIEVVRFEFPYMAKRRLDGKRRGPDRPPVLEATWKTVIAELGGGTRWVIGGKSMGGRIATRVADEVCARGVVCFGYPFHPPGKPEKLRTVHLESLSTRTLVLQGSRDTMGTREEVEGYELSASIQIEWLEDGDHSLAPRKKSGHTAEAHLNSARELATRFVRECFGAV